MHCAYLIVDGEKMSKSKGNFYTLRDLLGKGHSTQSIRYLLLTITIVASSATTSAANLTSGEHAFSFATIRAFSTIWYGFGSV